MDLSAGSAACRCAVVTSRRGDVFGGSQWPPLFGHGRVEGRMSEEETWRGGAFSQQFEIIAAVGQRRVGEEIGGRGGATGEPQARICVRRCDVKVLRLAASAALPRMIFRALIIAVSVVAMSLTPTRAAAGPIDFLKRVGHSIAKANRHARSPHGAPQRSVRETTAPQHAEEPVSKGDARDDTAATKGAQPGAQRLAETSGSATAERSNPAQEGAGTTNQPAKLALGDLPFGVPVPNRPGFVVSPYSPNGGYVDVNGYASGSPVKDPYTGKVFRVP
jgi:hypothetical protein